MNQNEFSTLIDQSGLTLTDRQKSGLFAVFPLFQAMVAKAAPPLPREIEPSVMFSPEVN